MRPLIVRNAVKICVIPRLGFWREVGLSMPNAIAANMRQIIYGGILIFMMFRYSRRFVAKKGAV
jgi:hypothetical protein